MNTAEKLNQIAENVEKVHKAGKKAEYDAFWDAVLAGGARTKFDYAFRYWGGDYIRPNRKIIATDINSLSMTFAANRSLKKVEANYFDFYNKQKGTSTANSAYYTFQQCASLEEVEDIGIQAEYEYHYTWWNCSSLHTIAVVRSDENTRWTNAFLGCASLVNLTINGIIGTNGFNVSSSPALSKTSIESIINALSTTTSSQTVSFSRTAITNAFGSVDNAEWAALVATKPNWTISLV